MTPRSTVIAVVAATTLAQSASTMGTAVFPVIAPPLAAELGVAPAAIGYQMSLAFGVAAIGAPFMSFAVGRWGACRASQIGLVLCAVAMAVALAGSLTALAVAAVLTGFTMTLMTPASGHLLFRFASPGKRNFIFSVKQTGVPGGWVVIALVAPALTLAFGWRSAVAFVMLATLAMALAMQPRRAHWDDDRGFHAAATARPLVGLRLLWRYPVLRWLAVSSFFLTFVQLCVGTFLVTMLVGEVGYSLVTAGVMLSLVQASGVIGRIVWGWIADRTGDTLGLLQKLAAATVGCCIATAFLGPSWPVSVTVLLFVAFGLVSVGWNGLFLAEIAHSSPRGMVSVATSAAMAWNFGGILVGPALFATIYRFNGSYAQTHGWMAFVALAGLIALTLSRAAWRRERACSAT